MANNYTVSTFTAVETLNDSIANANMITFADMEISPILKVYGVVL